jgi:tetratricopeptide (TPR) repeat protein
MLEPEPTASAEDLIAQGKALAAQQQYSAALLYFERATQLAPRSFTAWFHLGFTRNHLNEWQGGYDAYEQAVALDPHYVDAAVQRARTLGRLRRFKEWRAAVTYAADLRVEQRHARHLHAHE